MAQNGMAFVLYIRLVLTSNAYLARNVRACKTLWCLYNLKDEIVWIQYAAGPPCGPERESAWQVPRDTVVEMNVRFKQERLLSELKFDLSKFVKIVDDHLIGWIYYTNFADGIRVDGGEQTASVVNYHAEAKDRSLLCRNDDPNKRLERTRFSVSYQKSGNGD